MQKGYADEKSDYNIDFRNWVCDAWHDHLG